MIKWLHKINTQLHKILHEIIKLFNNVLIWCTQFTFKCY